MMNTIKKNKAADQSINLENAVAEKTDTLEEVNRKLVESESQFGRGIEEAPVPIIIHTEDGEILKISKTLVELTGYTLEDIPTIQAWDEKVYGAKKEDIQETVKALYSLNRRKWRNWRCCISFQRFLRKKTTIGSNTAFELS